MPRNVPSMAEGNGTSLADALNRVADELQLLRTSIDEFRTDFQWAVQNNRMPLSEHEVAANKIDDRPFLLPVFDEGETVELQVDGKTVQGEICRLDDATNSATVQLTLTGDIVQTSQDELLRLEPDEVLVATDDHSRPSDVTSEAGTLF